MTDEADFLSPGTRAALDAQLESFQRQTSRQVLVWIGRTTGDLDPELFAVKAFEAWKVGRAGFDDGLVLFVWSEDRKLRVEVGIGLEGAVTDLESGRIIRDVITPRLRSGDPDGAITAGVQALVAEVSGETAGATPESGGGGPGRPATLFEKIIGGIVLALIVIFVITHPGLALQVLFHILSHSGGGGGGGGSWGGGGGGGGWSGGGGRSRGGGASGSW